MLSKLRSPLVRVRFVVLAIASFLAWRFVLAMMADHCDPAWGIPPVLLEKSALILKALTITLLTDIFYPWVKFALAKVWPEQFGGGDASA